MTYRRRHRWLRRLALGLAFATFVAPAAARPDEGEQSPQVIPYLSHGILTEADKAAAEAEAIHDPYLTDVFVRQGESRGRPDGDALALRNALKAEAVRKAEAVHDPYQTDVFVRQGESLGGPDGEELSPSILGELVKSRQAKEPFIPGVTDFPKPTVVEETPVISYLSHGLTADDVVGPRPDDRADRFAHSDVAATSELASSPSVAWDDDTSLAIGIVVLALALGLGFGIVKWPRLAGM